MLTALGFFANGFYGMAYVAKSPWCYVYLALSTVLVAILRSR